MNQGRTRSSTESGASCFHASGQLFKIRSFFSQSDKVLSFVVMVTEYVCLSLRQILSDIL